jgi:pimeloyl-ACP methyl ester carboxylesterase
VSAPVVLIHGLWMTPDSWEGWRQRYEAKGHEVHAPAWPGLEGRSVEELNRDPEPLTQMNVAKVVDHYDGIIRGLGAPPIIIGHSFGGAFTQLLLDRGLGAAGVALHPAQVRGVFRLPLTTLKAASPVLANPLNRGKAVPFTPKQFHYAFANTLSEEESQAAYDRYHVPCAARILFQGANANLNPRSPLKVDFSNGDRAPLLIIGGTADHIVPAAVNRENHRRYKSSAVTEYREHEGRSHFTAGSPGWEQVADDALEWALAHAR